MSTAKGPSSGYIYQFVIALLELSTLNENESISIENVDDIVKIDEKGTYICTIQSKHSISSSGKSFGNTSEDLWKTLNIWVKNIINGNLKSGNQFIAISNKKSPSNSILLKIGNITFDDFIQEIKKIKLIQNEKLNKKLLSNKKGDSIKTTISRIEEVLMHPKELKIIFDNFELRVAQNQIKNDLYNKLLLSGYSEEQKENFYHYLLGWIQGKSIDFWTDGIEAIFSKQDFDLKYSSFRDVNLLKSLIFRKKEHLTNENLIDIKSINRNRLFIKQIEDIERFEKDEIIETAIIDFLCRDIEMNYLLQNSSLLTREDFLNFEKKCIEKWKETRRSIITKSNIEEYSQDEQLDIAIKLYDEIMVKIKMDFKDNFGFKDSNKYIQNGTFLSLSDRPMIGWIPNWEKKYTKN
jgi:hypothetical protein